MVDAIRRVSAHKFVSVEQVQATFQPPTQFRVSRSLYQAGTTLPVIAKEHQVYVMAGVIEIMIMGHATPMAAGFQADVPAGTYWLTVKGDQAASVVSVFDLDSIRSGIGRQSTYWSPLCRLVLQLRCWVRIVWREGSSIKVGYWGQLLTIPAKGYLEGPGGPIPLRDVEWVEISTNKIKGGMAGRPLEMIDVKDEIVAGLGGTQATWALRESTWSMEKLFEDQPVQLIRIANPFRSTTRP